MDADGGYHRQQNGQQGEARQQHQIGQPVGSQTLSFHRWVRRIAQGIAHL